MDISALQNNQIYSMLNYTQKRPKHLAHMEQYVKLNSLPENVIPVTDLKTKLTKWTSNNVHDKYSELHKPGTETEATHTWLRRSDILPEAEGFVEIQ